MKHILISSSGHKDYLTPVEACNAIRWGIAESAPDCRLETAPMADGGNGTMEAIVTERNGKVVQVGTHDSLFRNISANMGIIESAPATAVIEIAEAAGSAILKPHERQTMVATSYGVGEMILEAVNRKCARIIVGLGGSIVSDGGTGMAQALGVTFFDRDGKIMAPVSNSGFNALSLKNIHSFKTNQLKIDLTKVDIQVASDVDIPLLGENGQARSFGPQKGANTNEIEYLEEGFTQLANVFLRCLGKDVNLPYAGAAGGMGAGLYGFFNARLFAGAKFIADEIKLKEKIERSDHVITGEGCLDDTTLLNKAPFYTAALARSKGKPVTAVVGKCALKNPHRFFDEIGTCDCPDDAELNKSIIEAGLCETSTKIMNKIRKPEKTNESK